MKVRALKYLQEARSNSEQVIESVIEALPQQVSKVDLIPVMWKQFFRSHQIRTLLTTNVINESGDEEVAEKIS
eukprot:CAMPEP_0170502960 /NCGR_PEP_ID=MMETSP0208-20121228/43192_1 /TAXON_ID=197538 /ORGANISM="Strombidium inclinatum, Strain S3" /LENGTH=72 /DNA_ID=CAMNT_0010782357 /DNA_START=169 /DNA_END=384 /DNA_ORIENTATION=-